MGDWPAVASGAEVTGYYDGIDSNGAAISRVWYWANLDGAEVALGSPPPGGTGCSIQEAGWGRYLTTWPPTDTSKFVELLKALGTGIGNAAAHESGHWMEKIQVHGSTGLPGMHCGAGNTQRGAFSCQDNNNFVYEFYTDSGFFQCPGDPSSNGARFRYIDETLPGADKIHWQPEDRCWMARWLNVKDNTCQ